MDYLMTKSDEKAILVGRRIIRSSFFYKIQPLFLAQNDSGTTQIALLRGRSIARIDPELILELIQNAIIYIYIYILYKINRSILIL